MTAPSSVAVIGLGMIGGSVARGLAAQGIEVLGYDTNSGYLDAAVGEGIVSRRLSSALDSFGGADAVVIAVYGDAAIHALESLKQHRNGVRLITDVGSTKRSIVASAERLALGDCFVGSHPFAGDHRSGWPASRADLFRDEVVYLCPTSESSDSAIDTANSLWELLGGRPVQIDCAEHDVLLAWTSHLPHVVSATLALALAERGIDRAQLGRGGRDVTRLAGGSPDLWTSITIENASEIDAALAAMETGLATFRRLLADGDREALRARLAAARDWSAPP